jgi:RND family efflux transporter MFP subunit
MKKSSLFFLLALLLLALGLLTASCKKSEVTSGSPRTTTQSKAQKYHCPMHPTYIADKPGDCPICGMKLVPIKKEEAPTSSGSPVKPTTYTCPMHPNVVSNAPGICPECNMKLVPAKDSKIGERPASTNAASTTEHPGHVGGQGEAQPVPGRIAVKLSADKQQMIGLRLSPVEKRELKQLVRTTATLEHDETRLARIAPRFGGWIRNLKVNFTGQDVQKGQPLLTVYSPELLSAENEYLLAGQRFDLLRKNPTNPQLDPAKRLLESARRRLALWEIGEEEIAELERTGQPKDELLLRSPVTGYVITKTAIEGKAFMAGETLYEIGDLSRLWLRAYVFEFDLPLIKVGQPAKVTIPNLGNKTFHSTVTFLYPNIDPQTRRAEIRLQLENPKQELRPEMWGNVEIEASFGEVLAVPASAVISTGSRFVAFAKQEDERLAPRELKIGVKTDDYYQVLDGVNEGEMVVTRALFLVDAESQLKAAIAGMGAAGEHRH